MPCSAAAGAADAAQAQPGDETQQVVRMGANVAQSRCTQERVGNGVQQGIGVRVAQQTYVVRDVDAADDQLAAFDQCVAIVALADAEW